MDPITQGALGAVTGQIIKKGDKIFPASIMAALAAMSPDLDVLIRSSEDPLLFLVFHRQFTHSLFFIPFGALICALGLHWLIGKRRSFNFLQSYVICFLAYATHALLDACTTYGTLLLWPFSNERFSWNTIAVVDLFYTLPILAAVAMGLKLKSPWPTRIITIWVLFYPYWGHLQKQKAERAAHAYLSNRALSPNSDVEQLESIYNLSAKPSMSNIVLWKVIYETENRFFVDAIKVGLFDSPEEAIYFPGSSVKKLNIDKDLPWLDQGTQQAKDVERFYWFSMGYVALDDGSFIAPESLDEANTKTPIRIMDIRYSIVPNEINPLWSIGLASNEMDIDPKSHVSYQNHRDASKEKRAKFFDMLFAK